MAKSCVLFIPDRDNNHTANKVQVTTTKMCRWARLCRTKKAPRRPTGAAGSCTGLIKKLSLLTLLVLSARGLGASRPFRWLPGLDRSERLEAGVRPNEYLALLHRVRQGIHALVPLIGGKEEESRALRLVVGSNRAAGTELVEERSGAVIVDYREDGREDAPDLALFVGAHEERLVAGEHVEQHASKAGRDPGPPIVNPQVQLRLPQAKIIAGPLEAHPHEDLLEGVQAQDQLVPHIRAVAVERVAVGSLVLDPHLNLCVVKGPTGSQDKGDSRPAARLHLQYDHGKCGCEGVLGYV